MTLEMVNKGEPTLGEKYFFFSYLFLYTLSKSFSSPIACGCSSTMLERIHGGKKYIYVNIHSYLGYLLHSVLTLFSYYYLLSF